MTAYAIAHLREITPHAEIAEYIERITACLLYTDSSWCMG